MPALQLWLNKILCELQVHTYSNIDIFEEEAVEEPHNST